MDSRLLSLLGEGESFLLSLSQHEQDEAIKLLPVWKEKVLNYATEVAANDTPIVRNKILALEELAKRLENAFAEQANWVMKQHQALQHQHNVAQKYTQNV